MYGEYIRKYKRAGQWWRMSLIPALRRQRQVDLSEFEASLVYKMSSRIAKTVSQRNLVPKKHKKREKKLPWSWSLLTAIETLQHPSRDKSKILLCMASRYINTSRRRRETACERHLLSPAADL